VTEVTRVTRVKDVTKVTRVTRVKDGAGGASRVSPVSPGVAGVAGVGRAPQRQIRVHDDPFYRAVARGKAEGVSIGVIVSELLARYADGDLDI
jgi:hypothetical protein